MIYLEYIHTSLEDSHHHAVELNVSTIAEAARLFMAFEAGFGDRKLTLTSVGTQKKRGVEYSRWGSL